MDRDELDPFREWLPASRRGWAMAVLWVLSIGFWTQFAIASGRELEPQAAVLGWILVAMLMLGGLTVWAANTQTRRRRR